MPVPGKRAPCYSHRWLRVRRPVDLLDAAHIIPVEHERGTDKSNELLCARLHHRALTMLLHGIARITPLLARKGFQRLQSIGGLAGI